MPEEPIERRNRDEQEILPPPEKKKKRKSRKGMLFFLLFLTALGGVAGMHISGAWDARPLFYGSIPKIPWVGKDLAKFVGIPEEYALTVEQRRRLELERWSGRLNQLERNLKGREAELAALSADFETRSLLL